MVNAGVIRGIEMELVNWANGKGQKLILSLKEGRDLKEVVRLALHSYINKADGDYFEVEIEDGNRGLSNGSISTHKIGGRNELY